MAKIRKKKLKNKRLGNFFRCPEGQRTEPQWTGRNGEPLHSSGLPNGTKHGGKRQEEAAGDFPALLTAPICT